MNNMKLKKISGINEYYLDEDFNIKYDSVYEGFYRRIFFEDDDILWFKGNALIESDDIINSLNSMI